MRQVDIAEVQRVLEIHQVDGWLLFDFQKRNALAIEFLQIPHKAHLTRRLYYWIPQKGSPVKIVHAIEPFFLDAWPGQKHIYITWQQLEGNLCQILKGKKKVAMEFSEHCHIPYVSVVDAGSVDFVRSQGCQVVSSASFLQAFTCLLNESQKNSHFAAAKVLEEAVDSAWSFIARQLKNEMIITEYDVQQHVKEYYTSKGYVSEGDPICAVNEHSSDPHYCPTKEHSYQIKKDDFK
jgi:Xaa-Pro aminopeptidase